MCKYLLQLLQIFLEFPFSTVAWQGGARKRYIYFFQNNRNIYTLYSNCPIQDGPLLGNPACGEGWTQPSRAVSWQRWASAS